MTLSPDAWETYEAWKHQAHRPLEGGRPLRFRWSPSSLGDFQKCPWYFWATQVAGYRRPGNMDLLFGTALHDGLWAYYERCADGPEVALRAAVQTALDSGRELPVRSDKTVKTKLNLVSGLVEWADTYGYGTPGWLPLLSEAAPANEVPFEIDLDMRTPAGTPYTLYGILDRVVRFKGKPAIIDSKSTKFSAGSFYFDRYKPDTQISLYAGAASLLFHDYCGKVLIDAFFVTKTQGVTTFRGELDICDGAEAIEDVKVSIKQAEACVVEDHYPRNRTSCSLYGGCVFREVCSAPTASRHLILEQTFERKDR